MFNTFTDRFFHGVNKKNAIAVNSATLKGCISTSRQKVHSKSKPKTIRLFQNSNLTSRRSSLNNTMRSSTQCDFFKSENQFVPPPPSGQNNNQSRKKKHFLKKGYQFGPPMTSNQLHTLVEKHSNKNQNLEQEFQNQDQQNEDSAAICSLKDKLRRKIEMNAYKKYANAQHNYSNKRQQKVEQKHIRHLLEMMNIKNNHVVVQIQKQVCSQKPFSLKNEQQQMEQRNKAIHEVSKYIWQQENNIKKHANRQQKLIPKTQEQFGRLKEDQNENTHQQKSLNMQVNLSVNEDRKQTEILNRKKIHPGNSESLNSEWKIQHKNSNKQMMLLSQNQQIQKKYVSQKPVLNKQYKEDILSKQTEKFKPQTPNTFWNSNIDNQLDISCAINKKVSGADLANEKMIYKTDQRQIISATNITKKEKEQLSTKTAIPNYINKPKATQKSDTQIEEIQIQKKKEVNPRPEVRGKEKEKQEGKAKEKEKEKAREKEREKEKEKKRGERQLPLVEIQKKGDHQKNRKQCKTQQNMVRKEETKKFSKDQIQIKQQQQYTYDDITNEVEYVFYVTNQIGSICKADKDFIKEGEPEQICRLSKLSSYYVWQQIYFIKQYSLQLLLDKEQDFFEVPKNILRKPEFRRFVEEQVGELEKEIEKVQKTIQKIYGETSNLLPNSQKPLNIKKQINYHKKCMSSLQQYFTQIEKQYRKAVRGNNIKENRYVQKLCEIIQMVCQLKFLNGQEIKQYQQLRQIQNYTSHYQQFKHFVVL